MEIKTFFSSLKNSTISLGEKGKGNSFDSKDSEIKKILESDKVKIIPATEEQKLQYFRHYSNHMDGLDSKEDFPFFSKEQLNSVPDVIEDFYLTEYDKKLLLLDRIENDPHQISYYIDKNNNLTSSFLVPGKDVNDIEEITKVITKKEIQFVDDRFNVLENKQSFKEEENFYIIKDLKLSENEKKSVEEKKEIIITKAQLEKIPDILQDNKLSDWQKKNLFLGESINLVDPKNEDELKVKFRIQNDGKISYFYPSGEQGFLKAKEVIFNKEEKFINITETEEYKKVISSLSLESPDILKKMENEGEKQILSDFQDKVILSWKLTKEAFEKKRESNFDISIDSFYKDVISDRFNVLNTTVKNTVPLLEVYLLNKKEQVSFQTIPKPLEKGDKINILTKSGELYAKGEVKNINNGEIELKTTKGIVRAPFDSRIEPLFLNDSQNKKTHIEYGVNETITLLDQKKLGMHENYFENRMYDFTNLLKGNKTSILPFEKGNEKEEGKLQIIKNFEGKPVVSLELKKTKLNIDAAYIQYGTDDFKLNLEQKEQLKKTGELGLVNLTSNVTNKESKLWVSIDKELNTIVTKKSEAIAINKIFGTSTTEEQKNKLKSGEGVLLDIKGKNYFIIASAASKNSDGLRIFHETKARELNLIPNKNLDQFDVKKTGIKI